MVPPLFIPTSPVEAIWSITLWVSVWLIIYFSLLFGLNRSLWLQASPQYQQLKSKRLHLELAERIASSIHAIWSFIGAIITFSLDDITSNRSVKIVDGSPYLLTFLMPSIAWFVFDIGYTIYMGIYVWEQKSPVLFDLFHHTIGILSESQFMASQNLHAQVLAQVGRLLLLTEVTTPFVNARWILLKFRCNPTHIVRISLCILLGFIIFRNANCLLMLTIMFRFGLSDLAKISIADTITMCVTIFGLTLLNGYWTSLMIRRAVSVLLKGKTATKDDTDDDDADGDRLSETTGINSSGASSGLLRGSEAKGLYGGVMLMQPTSDQNV